MIMWWLLWVYLLSALCCVLLGVVDSEKDCDRSNIWIYYILCLVPVFNTWMFVRAMWNR